MEIKRTHKTVVNFGKEVTTNAYVANWNGNVDLTFTDHDKNGTCVVFELTLPVEVARSLVDELTSDIIDYDKKREEEAAAEEAENAINEE